MASDRTIIIKLLCTLTVKTYAKSYHSEFNTPSFVLWKLTITTSLVRNNSQRNTRQIHDIQNKGYT